MLKGTEDFSMTLFYFVLYSDKENYCLDDSRTLWIIHITHWP